MLPAFTRGLLSLPDHPALLRELALLERTPGRIGKDQVAHPRHAHDDCANALAGALRQLTKYQLDYTSMADGPDEYDGPPPSRHPAPMTVGEYMDRLQGYVFQYSGGRCWR
jgi:hypothetical protein